MKRRTQASSNQVQAPNNEAELAHIIEDTARNRGVVRVVGAGRSVPAAIAQPGDALVSLEHMHGVLAYDAVNGTIQAQAGMTLGPSPKWRDRPANETLAGFLRAQALADGRGWALPALGDITHPTLGGFISTGSAAGSLQHSFGDALAGLRFIDGLGNVHDVRRGDELFDAAAVSLGLFGVITRVTLRCDAWFDVIGRETTTPTEECEVDLFGAGARGLASFLRETPYARLSWWPQPGVNKVTVWQARRMQPVDYLAHNSAPLALKPHPYVPAGPLPQLIVHGFYNLLAFRFGSSLFDELVDDVTSLVAPRAINAFVANNQSDPTLFWDTWNEGLPMANTNSDTITPTEFTELWIPLERAQEVMIALRDHYRDHGLSAAGTYACEIYAAKRSSFWLSPAYGGDMLRVELSWFAKNRDDAKTRFYPQFWSLLERFGFRPHWGKTLPAADSELGAHRLRERYPRWDSFMQLREQFDPEQVFVSEYWRNQLGIAAAPAARQVTQSMVVPRVVLRDDASDAARAAARARQGVR